MTCMSMTGFGRCEVERDGRKIMLELKSVNHRFLDISMRLPRMFAAHEDFVRKTLAKRLARGHVDIYLKYENRAEGSQVVEVNHALLKAYLAAFGTLQEEYSLQNDIKASHVLRINDVLNTVPVAEDDDALRELLGEALAGALEQLCAARQSEGANLSGDVQVKLEVMEGRLAVVEARAPAVVQEYREKLAQRLEQLLDKQVVDEARLATEVAYFAERGCIDEEIVRLKSHFGQMRKTLADGGAMGRQLDFIVQEMNREVNTICSKSTDTQITAAGLDLKSEIEKIREQVQNIE